MQSNQIITGNCLEKLEELPENSVHCVMTSPPYWNLRDYDHQDQLGLEETADEYVSNIADVMDAVGRVLRKDGSLWLNLGDTYENKDCQMIPQRVALELRNRGWILRNKVVWAKPNPMPQSVKDRLNDTTERIYHFVQSGEYFYDLDAIRESHKTSKEEYIDKLPSSESNKTFENSGKGIAKYSTDEAIERRFSKGKNPGDVFDVTTKPFPDAHFAVYPPELTEKPIKATVPPKVCPECGTGYERDNVRQTLTPEEIEQHYPERCADVSEDRNDGYRHQINHTEREKLRDKLGKGTVDNGFKQLCNCETDTTESGIILDPFAGAGTTLLKAKELGRKYVGIELNPEYADMARARVGLTPNNPETLRENENQEGLEAYE